MQDISAGAMTVHAVLTNVKASDEEVRELMPLVRSSLGGDPFKGHEQQVQMFLYWLLHVTLHDC